MAIGLLAGVLGAGLGFLGNSGGGDSGGSRSTALDTLVLGPQLASQNFDLLAQFGVPTAQHHTAIERARVSGEQGILDAFGTRRRDRLTEIPEIGAAASAVQGSLREIGASAIESELLRQALEELQLGGDLSAGEERQAQQDARAAFDARGLANSPSAASAEVLNLFGVREARKSTRRAFAGAVDAARTGRRATDASIGTSALATTAGVFDPLTEILGRGSAVNLGQTQNLSSILPVAASLAQSDASAALGERQSQRNLDASLLSSGVNLAAAFLGG